MHKQPASIVLNRRWTSAGLSGDAPSAAPAKQNETEVLQVLHLPRKSSRPIVFNRCWTFRGPSVHVYANPSHAKAAGAHSTHSSLDFRGPLWRQPAPTVLNRRRTFADRSGGAPRPAPATLHETEELQVLRLPGKMTLRSSKCCACQCCACQANAAGVHSTQSSPDFGGPLGRLRVLCSWRCVDSVVLMVLC